MTLVRAFERSCFTGTFHYRPNPASRVRTRGFARLRRMQHPSGIPEKIVRKVVARRGKLHAFDAIDSTRTALVVIDLDVATVGNDPASLAMISAINATAGVVRQTGGSVAWVLSSNQTMPKHFAAILGPELAKKYFEDGQPGGDGTKLHPDLVKEPNDIV